jgi:uncharacterized protein
MSYIYTLSGKIFDYRYTEIESIDINDVAHSLAMKCRFNGQIKRFYSVAEHCIIMSRVCSEENALWALLHDATEAYVADLPSPLKRLLPDYIEIEDNIMRVICDKYDLPYEMPDEVKKLDYLMLIREAYEFHGMDALRNVFKVEHYPLHLNDIKIEYMDFEKGKNEYIKQFNDLIKRRK